jgi:hypothetical protein
MVAHVIVVRDIVNLPVASHAQGCDCRCPVAGSRLVVDHTVLLVPLHDLVCVLLHVLGVVLQLLVLSHLVVVVVLLEHMHDCPALGPRSIRATMHGGASRAALGGGCSA